MAVTPFEVIAAPATIYVAATGTAFPAIDAAPGGSWTQLGTSGDENYGEEGVTAAHEQTIQQWRGLGNTGPKKVFRTEENLRISFVLVDLTLEQFAKLLNDVTVTDTAAGAGTAGHRSIPLRQGPDVTRYALLARGPSPYGNGWNMQWEIRICYQGGNPTPVFRKGQPAGLQCEFIAIEDPDAASDGERFGVLRAQDAAPA